MIATGRKNTEDGNDRDTDTRYASALALKTAFRQVKILRQVLKDSSSILITDLVESAKKWEEARAERLGPAKQPAVDPLPSIEAIIREKRPKEPDNNNDQDSYSVERDVKSQVIFMAPSEETFSAKEGLMEPLQMEISTEVYKGRFPDQYVSIEHLLGGEFLRFNDYLNHWKASERNSMMKPHKDSIRYFHMAFNNMTVSRAQRTTFKARD